MDPLWEKDVWEAEGGAVAGEAAEGFVCAEGDPLSEGEGSSGERGCLSSTW